MTTYHAECNGWRLWHEVALWAESELGLVTVPALTDHDRGVGRPIPREWDPRQGERY